MLPTSVARRVCCRTLNLATMGSRQTLYICLPMCLSWAHTYCVGVGQFHTVYVWEARRGDSQLLNMWQPATGREAPRDVSRQCDPTCMALRTVQKLNVRQSLFLQRLTRFVLARRDIATSGPPCSDGQAKADAPGRNENVCCSLPQKCI